MGFEAVSDTGPLLHLHELDVSKALSITRTCTTTEVEQELKRYNVLSSVEVRKSDNEKTVFYAARYEIGVGEASCIALCKSENIPLLFTDDLAARGAAMSERLEVHGTIGILLRAYRDGLLSREETLVTLDSIKLKSTLFITAKLVDEAIVAVKKYSS